MAAQNYNYNATVKVKADISQASASLNDLKKILDSIGNTPKNIKWDADVKRASDAALTLKSALSSAFNINTGKLNLNEFNRQLAVSNTSVKELANNLMLSAQGGKALNQLVQQLNTAEMTVQRSKTLLSSFGTTLKNSFNWTVASGMVHGLQSTIAGAFNYVKDLNSTLNNIRIVTGQSADQMVNFTKQASMAAKELSSTTKAYAEASLIYFQQGDTQAQAMQKAAITTKAANVAFSASAKEMSEMLTAVWNSYKVGSQELEHYVDIMAALGAATASSTEEIATAMQKVAATANTVGVSMKSMASMIATVASVTRESPQAIGTAYKTILARMGDLKLGETLEDGTSLGTVSSALKSIGVNVLDATGNLRQMEEVINELGSKWQAMSNAQKTATAEVLAGKRQYTQLMALFENWDKYQENIQIAETSNGTLNRQAKIYAESWEAASKRVRSSTENLWNQLIDDKGFIKALNHVESIIDAISKLIDNIGGLSGLFTHIGLAAAQAFGPKLQANINKIGYGLENYYQQARYDKAFIPGKGKIDLNQKLTGDYVSYQGQLMSRSAAQQLAQKEGKIYKEPNRFMRAISVIGGKGISMANARTIAENQEVMNIAQKSYVRQQRENARLGFGKDSLRAQLTQQVTNSSMQSMQMRNAILANAQKLSADGQVKAEANLQQLSTASGNAAKALEKFMATSNELTNATKKETKEALLITKKAQNDPKKLQAVKEFLPKYFEASLKRGATSTAEGSILASFRDQFYDSDTEEGRAKVLDTMQSFLEKTVGYDKTFLANFRKKYDGNFTSEEAEKQLAKSMRQSINGEQYAKQQTDLRRDFLDAILGDNENKIKAAISSTEKAYRKTQEEQLAFLDDGTKYGKEEIKRRVDIRAENRRASLLKNKWKYDEEGKEYEEILYRANGLMDAEGKLTEAGEQFNAVFEKIQEATSINDKEGFGKALDELLELTNELNNVDEAAKKAGEGTEKESLNILGKLGEGLKFAQDASIGLVAGLSQGSNIIATMADNSATLGDRLMAGASAIMSIGQAFAAGGIVGGVAAIAATAFSAIQKAMELQDQERQRNAEINTNKVREENQKAKEALDSVANAQNSLNTTKNLWEDQTISAEEYVNQLMNVANSLNDYRGIVKGLSGDYEGLAKSIQKAIDLETLRDIERAERAANQAKINARSEFITAAKDSGAFKGTVADGGVKFNIAGDMTDWNKLLDYDYKAISDTAFYKEILQPIVRDMMQNDPLLSTRSEEEAVDQILNENYGLYRLIAKGYGFTDYFSGDIATVHPENYGQFSGFNKKIQEVFLSNPDDLLLNFLFNPETNLGKILNTSFDTEQEGMYQALASAYAKNAIKTEKPTNYKDVEKIREQIKKQIAEKYSLLNIDDFDLDAIIADAIASTLNAGSTSDKIIGAKISGYENKRQMLIKQAKEFGTKEAESVVDGLLDNLEEDFVINAIDSFSSLSFFGRNQNKYSNAAASQNKFMLQSSVAKVWKNRMNDKNFSMDTFFESSLMPLYRMINDGEGYSDETIRQFKNATDSQKKAFIETQLKDLTSNFQEILDEYVSSTGGDLYQALLSERDSIISNFNVEQREKGTFLSIDQSNPIEEIGQRIADIKEFQNEGEQKFREARGEQAESAVTEVKKWEPYLDLLEQMQQKYIDLDTAAKNFDPNQFRLTNMDRDIKDIGKTIQLLHELQSSLDPREWKLEEISQNLALLGQEGNLQGWMNASNIERAATYYKVLANNMEQFIEAAKKSGMSHDNALIMYAEYVNQASTAYNDAVIVDYNKQLENMETQWDRITSAAQSAADAVRSFITNLDELDDLTKVEKLRQDLTAAGLDAAKVEELINDMTDKSKSKESRILAANNAQTLMTLAQIGTIQERQAFTSWDANVAKNAGYNAPQINLEGVPSASDIATSVVNALGKPVPVKITNEEPSGSSKNPQPSSVTGDSRSMRDMAAREAQKAGSNNQNLRLSQENEVNSTKNTLLNMAQVASGALYDQMESLYEAYEALNEITDFSEYSLKKSELDKQFTKLQKRYEIETNPQTVSARASEKTEAAERYLTKDEIGAFNALVAKNNALKEERDGYLAELGASEEEIAALNTTISEKEATIESLTQENAALEAQIAAMQAAQAAVDKVGTESKMTPDDAKNFVLGIGRAASEAVNRIGPGVGEWLKGISGSDIIEEIDDSEFDPSAAIESWNDLKNNFSESWNDFWDFDKNFGWAKEKEKKWFGKKEEQLIPESGSAEAKRYVENLVQNTEGAFLQIIGQALGAPTKENFDALKKAYDQYVESEILPLKAAGYDKNWAEKQWQDRVVSQLSEEQFTNLFDQGDVKRDNVLSNLHLPELIANAAAEEVNPYINESKETISALMKEAFPNSNTNLLKRSMVPGENGEYYETVHGGTWGIDNMEYLFTPILEDGKELLDEEVALYFDTISRIAQLTGQTVEEVDKSADGLNLIIDSLDTTNLSEDQINAWRSQQSDLLHLLQEAYYEPGDLKELTKTYYSDEAMAGRGQWDSWLETQAEATQERLDNLWDRLEKEEDAIDQGFEFQTREAEIREYNEAVQEEQNILEHMRKMSELSKEQVSIFKGQREAVLGNSQQEIELPSQIEEDSENTVIEIVDPELIREAYKQVSEDMLSLRSDIVNGGYDLLDNEVVENLKEEYMELAEQQINLNPVHNTQEQLEQFFKNYNSVFESAIKIGKKSQLLEKGRNYRGEGLQQREQDSYNELLDSISSGKIEQDTAKEFLSNLSDYFSPDASDEFKTIGQNIMLGIVAGMQDAGMALSGVDVVAEDFTMQALAAFKAACGISSPAERFKYIGQMILMGIKVGFEEMTENPEFKQLDQWEQEFVKASEAVVKRIKSQLWQDFNDDLGGNGSFDDFVDNYFNEEQIGQVGKEAIISGFSNMYSTPGKGTGAFKSLAKQVFESLGLDNLGLELINFDKWDQQYKDLFAEALVLQLELNTTNAENQINMLIAQMEQGWVKALNNIYSQNKETANQILSVWKQLFSDILSTQKGLFEGKSIFETQNEEAQNRLATQFLMNGVSEDQIYNLFKSKKASDVLSQLSVSLSLDQLNEQTQIATDRGLAWDEDHNLINGQNYSSYLNNWKQIFGSEFDVNFESISKDFQDKIKEANEKGINSLTESEKNYFESMKKAGLIIEKEGKYQLELSQEKRQAYIDWQMRTSSEIARSNEEFLQHKGTAVASLARNKQLLVNQNHELGRSALTNNESVIATIKKAQAAWDYGSSRASNLARIFANDAKGLETFEMAVQGSSIRLGTFDSVLDELALSMANAATAIAAAEQAIENKEIDGIAYKQDKRGMISPDYIRDPKTGEIAGIRGYKVHNKWSDLDDTSKGRYLLNAEEGTQNKVFQALGFNSSSEVGQKFVEKLLEGTIETLDEVNIKALNEKGFDYVAGEGLHLLPSIYGQEGYVQQVAVNAATGQVIPTGDLDIDKYLENAREARAAERFTNLGQALNYNDTGVLMYISAWSESAQAYLESLGKTGKSLSELDWAALDAADKLKMLTEAELERQRQIGVDALFGPEGKGGLIQQYEKMLNNPNITMGTADFIKTKSETVEAIGQTWNTSADVAMKLAENDHKLLAQLAQSVKDSNDKKSREVNEKIRGKINQYDDEEVAARQKSAASKIRGKTVTDQGAAAFIESFEKAFDGMKINHDHLDAMMEKAGLEGGDAYINSFIKSLEEGIPKDLAALNDAVSAAKDLGNDTSKILSHIYEGMGMEANQAAVEAVKRTAELQTLYDQVAAEQGEAAAKSAVEQQSGLGYKIVELTPSEAESREGAIEIGPATENSDIEGWMMWTPEASMKISGAAEGTIDFTPAEFQIKGGKTESKEGTEQKLSGEQKTGEPTRRYLVPDGTKLHKETVPAPSNKGGGKKGGGGGGGKSGKKEKHQTYKSNIQRYHRTDSHINNLSQTLGKMNNVKQRMYGKDILKSMKTEIDYLKEQEKWYKTLLVEAKEWLKFDKDLLQKYFPKIKFDEDGSIKNYTATMKEIIDEYNRAVDAYNASAREKDDKNRLNDAKTKMEEQQKLLNNYEESLNKVNEAEQKILETQNTIADEQLEIIQERLKFVTEWNQKERDLLDYLNTKYEQVLVKQSNVMHNYITEVQNLDNDLSHMASTFDELNAAYKNGDIFQAQYIQGLQDLQDQILDTLSSIEEMRSSIKELYGNTLDLWNDKISKNISLIEQQKNTLSSFIDMMKLTDGGESAYAVLQQFYNGAIDVNKQMMNINKQNLDTLEAQLPYYEQQMKLGEVSKENYEALLAHITEARETFLQSIQDTMQAAQDAYINSINALQQELNRSFAGMYDDVAYMQEQFNSFKEIRDQYLTATTQGYEVAKLNRQIDKDLSETESDWLKAQLTQFQEILNAEDKQNKLTQYEIDKLNNQYNVLKAIAELEDARAAKDTVRLTRDENGNFMYQYTADEDKVNDAEQKYDDAVKSLYDLIRDHADEAQQQILDAMQQFSDKYGEILQDMTLTTEQKTKRIQDLIDWASNKLGFWTDDFAETMNDLNNINEIAGEFWNRNGRSLTEEVNGQLGGQLVDFANHITAAQNVVDGGLSALSTYDTNIAKILEEAGINDMTMDLQMQRLNYEANYAIDNINTLDDELTEVSESIRTMATAWDTFNEKLEKTLENMQSMFEMIQGIVKADIGDSSLGEYIDIGAKWSSNIAGNTFGLNLPQKETPFSLAAYLAQYTAGGVHDENEDLLRSIWETWLYEDSDLNRIDWNSKTPQGGNGSGGGSSGGKGGSGGGSGGKSGSKGGASFDYSCVTEGSYNANNDTWTFKNSKGQTITLDRRNANAKGKQVQKTKNATGGLNDYTGWAWMDGTLQKPELVLNATDTQRMFDIIDAERSISAPMLSNIVSLIDTLANIQGINSRRFDFNNGEPQAQNITINADFPNVSSRDEIKAAFGDMMNMASQYINSTV